MRTRGRTSRRLAALLLSWVFTATTVWAAAPPVRGAAPPAPEGPRPSVVPGLKERLLASTPLGAATHGSAQASGRPSRLREDGLLVARTGADPTTSQEFRPGQPPHVQQPIVLHAECVEETSGGGYVAHFGYTSANGNAIVVSHGPKNFFSPGPATRGQPIKFLPGRSRPWPHAAFRVGFDGSPLTWTIEGPDGVARSATVSLDSPRCGAPAAETCEQLFWGPRRFRRTFGKPNEYVATVEVPAWVSAPYVLHVTNGEANGRYRVSSARIAVDGVEVAGPGDFNPQVAGFERTVTLQPTSTLEVRLASAPGSYLLLSFCGTLGDHTPPVVTWTAPMPGSATNDATPRLALTWTDPVGSGEPGASGVDPDTLSVTLDGEDRTALFSIRPDDASAELPDNLALAEGLHTLVARVRDHAGHETETPSEFRVDLQPPTVAMASPTAGAYLQAPVTVRIVYEDESALDGASLRVLVNGTEITSLFTAGPTEATATLALGAGLVEGANQIQAFIRDAAGTESTAAVAFHVDATPPTLVIGQPADGSHHGSADVEATVEYRDDQALDLDTFVAEVDGVPVSLDRVAGGATGWLGPLEDGPHRFLVRIRDRAGHDATTEASFVVDTTLPTIRVVQPPPGGFVGDDTPDLLVTYEDDDGVDITTLRVLVDGVEHTPALTVEPDVAYGSLPSVLAEGPHQVAAEISDLTGNTGTVTSDFTVDTTPPQVSVDAPPALTNERLPTVTVAWTDAVSGVDPGTARILVDGTDRTELFAVGASGATGVLDLDPPLADGPHEVAVTVRDRAGNEGDATSSFALDTTAPVLTVLAPLGFVNDATPEVRVSVVDEDGSGIAPDAVRLALRDAEGVEVPLEPTWTGPDEVTAVVPDAAPLVDGTYRVLASATDRAENTADTDSPFALDTVAPTFLVETPAPNQWLGTATPVFDVLYSDDASGIDPSAFTASIDGVDVTARFTPGPDRAPGELLPEDALAEGAHALTVQVFDRAGNAGTTTGPSPLRFSVDLTPPRLTVDTPAPGSLVGTPVALARLEYGDGAGSGVVPETLTLTLDGVALPTDGWTLGPDAAEGPLVPPAGDGTHVLEATVEDAAGNVTTTPAPFTVDSLPPVVTLTGPEDGSYHAASPVTLTGTVEDADPEVAVDCVNGASSASATLDAGTFSCELPLAEGENTVRARGRDRLGHESTSDPRTLHLDTVPPEIVFTEPAPGAVVSASEIDVAGRVNDASPLRSVRVEGLEAEISGQDFTVRNVPLGDEAEVVLQGEAEDLAGNVGQATLPLAVDRVSPVVTITRPAADELVTGPIVEVEGEVVDQSDVTVEVNGVPEDTPPSLRAPRSFRARVPVTESTTLLVALALDAANNPPGRHEVPIRVDSVPPEITISSPAPGLVTNAPTVLVTGTVTDASPIDSFTVGGTPAELGADGSFQVEVPLPTEGVYPIPVEAMDRARNLATEAVEVTVDRTPPTLEIASPAPGSVLGAAPVTVEGTVQDPHLAWVTVDGQEASLTLSAWQALITVDEGGHTFVVRAEDTAGNATALSRSVTIDLSAPVVAFTSPTTGITREPTVAVAGTVRDVALDSLAVNGSAVSWTGDPSSPAGATFSLPAFALVDQQETFIEAVAEDGFGRTDSASVSIFRDSLPPAVELQTPERLVRGEPGLAVATVSDGAGLGIAQVVFSVDDAVQATLTEPPWELVLEVPELVPSGGSITVSVQAWDVAQNVSPPVSRVVVIASEGVVTGRVLADETSLPLEGATVRLVGGGAASVVTRTTDEVGRYALPAETATARVEIEAPDRLAVERELPVEPGVGTVPVDARLVPLAPPSTVGPDGATLALGAPRPVTVTFDPGLLAAETPVRLTRLSAQGLPGLLPLGWSPLAAFDLRSDGAALPGPLAATAGDLPDGPVHLVQYRPSVHAWVVVVPGLEPTSGALAFSLSGPGSWALVVADPVDPPLPVAGMGEPLAGSDMEPIPATATSTGVVDPPVLPPSGGSATGTLTVESPLPLPSGTVVQAEVTETFTLASGDVASEEVRSQDIVLYRTGPVDVAPGAPEEIPPCEPASAGATALCAAFPITPSRAFDAAELIEGRVHLDILAGREGVRGRVGGSDAVKVETAGGEASVFVPAQALPENTAIAVETSELSEFLPQDGVVPLAEVVVDFSGETLGLGAELSVASPGVAAEDTLLVARVDRIDGVPHLTAVALAALEGERLVTVPYAGLPGVVTGGRYVFYRLTGPVGFVSGRTTKAGASVAAVVESAGLPFIGHRGAGGQYVIAVAAGEVTLSARVPGTSSRGTRGPLTVEAVPAPPAVADIELEGVETLATVDPPDGTVDRPVTQQLEITTPTAILQSTVTADSVRLWALGGGGPVAVPVQLLLSASGRRLSVIPESRLAYETTYQLEAVGLVDVFGAGVIVPATSFRTRKEIPPAFHPERLVFTFPDEVTGLVTVSGPGKADAPPDGTFESGTEILIINASNGVVLTLKAGNENQVDPFQFPATINDRLMITVTDPFGNTTSFERSQFTNPETGETAVGPGGGTVTGPGGVELRIPEGAVDKGVIFKIAGLTPEELETEVGDLKAPDVEGATLASALRIEAPSKPTFKREVDLVFPLPEGVVEATRAEGQSPDDAFFYVYRRWTGPEGSVLFETVDWAEPRCPDGGDECAAEEKQIQTASFPFLGLVGSAGALGVSAAGVVAVGAVATAHVYLMWTYAALLPGQPTEGVVTGRVVRPEWPEGATTPVYKGVKDVPVWGKDAGGQDLVLHPVSGAPPQTVAMTDEEGQFSFFDSRFTTGTLEVRTQVDGVDYTATAYAVQLTDTKLLASSPALQALANAGRFGQVATVEITVAPTAPPPPPPAVDIRVMKLVEGQRVATDGVVVRGTPLLIGFEHSKNLDLVAAEVDGRELQVVADTFAGTSAGSPLAMDKLGQDPTSADGTFTPQRSGRFTVTASARPVVGDLTQVERFQATFLVVEGGEGNTAVREGEPPAVITARTLPRNNAGGVSVTTLPQVVFTEPVVNVPSGVFLEEVTSEGTVVETIPLSLLGVTPEGDILPAVGPTDTVVSVTLEPLKGLKFKTRYQLRVTSAIEDTDTTPLPLSPEYQSRFTTFGPEGVGGTEESFISPGLVVLGDRAYVLETAYTGGVATGEQYGYLRTYDISDPVEPVEAAERELIPFPPRDVAGESDTVAVITGSRTYYRLGGSDLAPARELVSTPANLLLYDVSEGQPVWSGAASLVTSLLEGYPNRAVVDGGLAYVAVAKRGIQVVDLATAKSAFEGTALYEVSQQMSTPGVGFASQAVKTIPVRDPDQPQSAALMDLKVKDLPWLGEQKRLVVSTGTSRALGLVVADASRLSVEWQSPVQKDNSSLDWGSAVAVADVQSRHLAVLGGYGKVDSGEAAGVVAIVDLTPMAARPPPGEPDPVPMVIRFLKLDHTVGDILITGTTAIVSGAQGSVSPGGEPGIASLIDLTNPEEARVVGTLTGIGSRLGLSDLDILFSTDRGFIKGTDTELAGIRTATLGTVTVIREVQHDPVMLALDRTTIEPQRIRCQAIFPREDVLTSEIEILQGTEIVSRIPVTLDERSSGEVVLPVGTPHPPEGRLRARLVVNRTQDEASQPRPTARDLAASSFALEPGGAFEISMAADEVPLEMTAINAAIQERLADGEDPSKILPAITWAVTGEPGATVEPSSEVTPRSGIYATEFLPGQTAGAVHRVQLRLGSTVLAQSAPIRVTPGQAFEAAIDSFLNDLPADASSVAELRISDIRDRFGNLVPDGTSVTWEVVEPLTGFPGDGMNALLPGSFREATTPIASGVSVGEYVAGVEPGWVRLRASVGDTLVKEFQLQQTGLLIDNTVAAGPIPTLQRYYALDVDSGAGRPANGTEVGWGLTVGLLEAEKVLTEGRARALFTWPLDPRVKTVGLPYIFATIGRTRADFLVDVGSGLEPSPGLFLEIASQRLLGDVSDGSTFEVEGADGTTYTIPSTTTVLVKGGTPGERVNLTLDSFRHPIHLPQHHYRFEGVTTTASGATTTEDLFGLSPAQVGSGVSVSYSVAAEGVGSLHFGASDDPGPRGLTIPSSSAFSPQGEFGISGYVRLDSSDTQTILSKPGSYAVNVVDMGGLPYLEFSVQNAGQTRRVVSADPLEVGAWQHFAARLEAQRLQLLLGESGPIRVGDAALPPDQVLSSLVIGASFQGYLDELGLLDLTRAPNYVFEDGRISVPLTLDELGEATVQLRSLGQFNGLPPSVMALFGANYIRLYEPPLLPGDWFEQTLDLNQVMRQRIGTVIGPYLADCVEGIADGESGGAIGAGCDILLGVVTAFTPAGPVVGVGQSSRDAVVAAEHYIDGKNQTESAVKGAVSVLGIIAEVSNPVGRLGRLGKRALTVLDGFKPAQRVVLKEALEAIARNLDTGEETVPGLLRILGDDGTVPDTVKNRLVGLLNEADDVGQMATALERIGRHVDYEDLLRYLDDVVEELSQNPRLNDVAGDRLASRVIGSLEEVVKVGEAAGVALPSLQPATLRGMAVFIGHGLQRGWKPSRIRRIWSDFVALNPQKAGEGFENMMRWIGEGEQHNIAGWVEFLAKGPGTLPRNSTAGAYGVLEHLAVDLKWQNVLELEAGFGEWRLIRGWLWRQERYVDILLKGPGGAVIKRELKTLRRGAPFDRRFAAEVSKDIGDAISRADPSNLEPTLAVELERLQYFFRGADEDLFVTITALRRYIREALGPDLMHLERHIETETLGREYPF